MAEKLGTATCVLQYLELDDIVRQVQVCRSWNRECSTQQVQKACVRMHGVPSRYRLKYWVEQTRHYSGTLDVPQLVEQFCKSINEHPTSDSTLTMQTEIQIDVPRTFPSHPFFKDGEGGQQMLSDVLLAVGLNHPLIGYCQGMNFVAATMLMLASESKLSPSSTNARLMSNNKSDIHGGYDSQFGVVQGEMKDSGNQIKFVSTLVNALTSSGNSSSMVHSKSKRDAKKEIMQSPGIAASAFVLLSSWIKQLDLTTLWRPGVPQLKLRVYQFDRLLAHKLPTLHHHFKSMELPPDFFASQWFMTLLSYNLPYGMLLRAWDLLILEGWKSIFRFGLCMLAHLEQDLLQLSIEETSQFMRESRQKLEGVNVNDFVSAAIRIKITNQMLLDLEGDYVAHILSVQLRHGKLASPTRHKRNGQQNRQLSGTEHDLPRNGLALLQEHLQGKHAVSHPHELSHEEAGALAVHEERLEDIDPRRAAQIQAEMNKLDLPTSDDIKVLRRKIELTSKSLERERAHFTHVAWGFVVKRTQLEEVLEYKSALIAQLQRAIETQMNRQDFLCLRGKIDQVQRDIGAAVTAYSVALRETASAQLDLQDETERKILLVEQLHQILEHSRKRTRSHLLSHSRQGQD